jgi:hypothetical protein
MVVVRTKLMLGRPALLKTPARECLEQKVLPYFVEGAAFQHVLFAGCEWYTAHYDGLFAGKRSYWTIDIDPKHARYGASGHHHMAGLEDVGDLFAAGELDLVLCNAVYGWGLDDPERIARAFTGCYRILRSGGVLVVGWNDLPEHDPAPLELASALTPFERFVFPPLRSPHYEVPGSTSRHVFDFYVRA